MDTSITCWLQTTNSHLCSCQYGLVLHTLCIWHYNTNDIHRGYLLVCCGEKEEEEEEETFGTPSRAPLLSFFFARFLGLGFVVDEVTVSLLSFVLVLGEWFDEDLGFGNEDSPNRLPANNVAIHDDLGNPSPSHDVLSMNDSLEMEHKTDRSRHLHHPTTNGMNGIYVNKPKKN